MSNKYTSVYDWLKYIKANVVGINLRELRFINSSLAEEFTQLKVQCDRNDSFACAKRRDIT